MWVLHMQIQPTTHQKSIFAFPASDSQLQIENSIMDLLLIKPADARDYCTV